jgi:WD40 repeat protein
VAAGEAIYLYTTGDYQEVSQFQAGVWTASLDFHPNGQWIVSGNYDGQIRVWQTGSFIPRIKFEAHPKGVNCVVFSPDGETLASCGKDAIAKLWDINSGDNLGQLIGGTYAIPSIAFTPDGANLIILNGDLIRIREIASQRFVHSIYGEGLYYSLAIHPSGQAIAAGDTKNTIQIWDITSEDESPAETRASRLTLKGHQGQANRPSALIWDVIFSPDGSLLASAGGDSTIRLWDSDSGELLLTLDRHTNAVTSLAFSPDGRSLASGSLDGSVIVWGIAQAGE